MIEYRLVITKNPTLRLWRKEDGKSTKMAEIKGDKASQIKESILPQVKLTPYMQWRDGRALYSLEEEAALRLFLAMKLITGVRDARRVEKLIRAAQKMDRGDSLNWYSFYLKLGFKSILAMRTAYL